jgi:hypothetical protein
MSSISGPYDSRRKTPESAPDVERPQLGEKAKPRSEMSRTTTNKDPAADGKDLVAQKERLGPSSKPAESSPTAKPGLVEPGHEGVKDGSRPSQIAEEIGGLVASACRRAGEGIDKATQRQLQVMQEALAVVLKGKPISSGADAQHAARAVIDLARRMGTAGLLDDKARAVLDRARDALLNKIGRDLSLILTPRVQNGRVLGLHAGTASKAPLSAEQAAGFEAAQQLVFELARMKVMPKRMSASSLVLLDLRDMLLRRSLAVAAKTPPGESFEPTFSDADLTGPALANIEDLLRKGASLSNDVAASFRRLAKGIDDTVQGGLGKSFQSVFNQGLPDVGKAAKDVGDQINGLTSAAGKLSVPAPTVPAVPELPSGMLKALDDVNAQLLKLTAMAPHGMNKSADAYLAQYQQGVGALKQQLGQLPPFEFTLPQPMVMDDGQGNRFALPAGSTLHRDVDGSIVIDTSGLAATSQGTNILAGKSTLKLGKDIDNLRFDSLALAGDKTNISGTGVEALINGSTKTAFIRADTAVIDVQSGKAELSGAQIMTEPGRTQLDVASLLYQSGTDKLGIKDLHLGEVVEGGTSTITASGNNVQAAQGKTQFTAAKLSITSVRSDDPNAPRTAEILGEGIDVVSGDTRLKAAQAKLQMMTRADGSSAISLAGRDLGATVGQQALTTAGETRIDLDYGTTGKLRSLTASNQGLIQFSDGAGTALKATDGQLGLKLDENGKLTGANAAAKSLSYASKDGVLAGDGGAMDLVFKDGKIKSATASADVVTYAATSGQASEFKGTGLKVAAQFNDQGVLKSMRGEAKSLQFNGDGVDARVDGKAVLAVDCNASGRITGVAVEGQDVLVKRAGTTLSGKDIKGSAQYGDDGLLKQVKASSGQLTVDGAFGKLNTSGKTEAVFDCDNGKIRGINLTNDKAELLTKDLKIKASGTSVGMSLRDDGKIDSITAANAKLDVQGTFGSLSSTGKLAATIKYGDDGNVSRLAAEATDLTLKGKNDTFGLKGGTLDATLDKGQLTGVDFGAKELTYSDGKNNSNLKVLSGTSHATFENGAVKSLAAEAASVSYKGKAINGHNAEVLVKDAKLNVDTLPDGGHKLTFGSQNGQFKIDGADVQFDAIRKIEVQTNPQGVITKMNADCPGRLSFEQQNKGLKVVGENVVGSFERSDSGGSKVAVSFDKAEVALKSENLKVAIQGGKIQMDERLVSIHVDKAEALLGFEKQWNAQTGLSCKVEQLDFVLGMNAAGKPENIDIQLQNLAVHAREINVIATNEEGKRLRFHAEFSKDGKQIESIFLQIPEGGEVEVYRSDVRAIFGPQASKLTREGNVLRLQSQGFNAKVQWKDLQVSGDIKNLDVALDPTPGRGLIVNNVTGGKIDVAFGPAKTRQKVHVDIDEMKNLMVKMTGDLSGLYKQGRLELIPTGQDSKLNARLTTVYKGFPISLQINNVGALTAVGQIKPNDVFVSLVDPTGKGTIKAKMGPLSFEGGEVKVSAKYNQFSGSSLLSLIDSIASSGSDNSGRRLCVQADGKIRLKVGSKLFAEGILLPPRTGDDSPSQGPKYLTMADASPKPTPWGVVLGVGGEVRVSKTKNLGVGIRGGVLPASTFEVATLGGTQAKLGGVSLPIDRLQIPATAIAGARVEVSGKEPKDLKVSAEAGVFLNIANPISKQLPSDAKYVSEQIPGGVYGNVTAKKGPFSVSVQGFRSKKEGSSKDEFGGLLFFRFDY